MYFCTGIWVLISICAANKELYVRERGAVHKPEDGRGTRSLCRPNILCQSRVRADVIKTISKEEPSTDPSTDVVFIKELDDDSTFAFRFLVDGYVRQQRRRHLPHQAYVLAHKMVLHFCRLYFL
jgi:hypothetical protein